MSESTLSLQCTLSEPSQVINPASGTAPNHVPKPSTVIITWSLTLSIGVSLTLCF